MIRQAASRIFLITILVFAGYSAVAAPYAAMVVDARTGEVLHSVNADTRLHPASLTKMMTLYVTFEAIRNGEITLETKVKISNHAASEPPSKLGLKAGQRIALKYLIRAAAVKSANDAATAIGEAVSGSEAAFARRMNKTAKALGMNRTTFKNANGLTETGHMSTARDMTNLGRHLFYDFPEYYNLFSRRSTDAGIKEVNNTNRKFLAAYKGADGIKTGYTAAAGFNLVASAQRGSERIIATVFGGRSTATRNEKMAELLDLGFKRAPSKAAVQKPEPPSYTLTVAVNTGLAVMQSPRPLRRHLRTPEETEQMQKVISLAVAQVVEEKANKPVETVDEVVISEETRPQPRAEEPKVVTRLSSSDGRIWGIHLGGFSTRSEAEKLLLTTALRDLTSLDGAMRKIVTRGGKYHANFVGMTETLANRACDRLRAARQTCTAEGPKG